MSKYNNHRKNAPRKMRQVIKQEVSKKAMNREESINMFFTKDNAEEITITEAVNGKRSDNLNGDYFNVGRAILLWSSILVAVVFAVLIMGNNQ